MSAAELVRLEDVERELERVLGDFVEIERRLLRGEPRARVVEAIGTGARRASRLLMTVKEETSR